MINESTATVELGGEKRKLYFNANTMCAYEEATGKFFLETVSDLYDVMREYVPALRGGGAPAAESEVITPPEPGKNRRIGAAVLRRVSMKDLRALLWAACHYYERDEPVWPLTLSQVGRQITPLSVPRLFLAYMIGQSSNSPTVNEMGESQASRPEPTPKAEASDAPPAKSGGALSTAVLEDALG